MKFQSDKTNLVILALIAVVFLVGLSCLLQFPANYLLDSFVVPDAHSYLDAARPLYTEGFKATAVRPFGYPVLLGVPYIFGIRAQDGILQYSLFLNVALWLGSVAMMYAIVKQLINSRYAFFASLLFIFCISGMLGIFEALTETLFIFVILSFLYFLLLYFKRPTARPLLSSLFFLCFSVLVRPISLYFALLFLVICLFIFVKKKMYREVALAALIFISTLGAQAVNMHRQFGTYSLSYIQGYTTDMYLVMKAKYIEGGKKGTFGQYYDKYTAETDSVLAAQAGKDEVQYWQAAAVLHSGRINDEIKTGKKYLLYSYLYNMYENIFSGCSLLHINKNVHNTSYFAKLNNIADRITTVQNKLFTVMLLLFSVFVFFKWIRGRYPSADGARFILIINLIALYFLLTSGISFWQGDRFAIVWYPLFIISTLYNLHAILLANKTGATHREKEMPE